VGPNPLAANSQVNFITGRSVVTALGDMAGTRLPITILVGLAALQGAGQVDAATYRGSFVITIESS
jgi:hypothetical protein